MQKPEDEREDMPGADGPDVGAVYARVRSLVYRLVGPGEAFEDIVQTTMERFLKAQDAHRGEGTIEAFADGIAVNVARDWMRTKKRRTFLMDLFADQNAWPAMPAGPAEQVESRDRLRRLVNILDRIKPAYRMAWSLYYVDGRSVPEIARIEGASESAVRTRILRARGMIRERARRDPVLAEWLGTLGEAP